MTVACPACFAEAGEPCRPRNGMMVHAVRVTAWRVANDRPADHLLAEVRGLDPELMVFLVTWLATAHPDTAIAGLDAVRRHRDARARAAGVDPGHWADLGSGAGR